MISEILFLWYKCKGPRSKKQGKLMFLACYSAVTKSVLKDKEQFSLRKKGVVPKKRVPRKSNAFGEFYGCVELFTKIDMKLV